MAPSWQVWCFWLSLLAVVYPYFLYPLLLVSWNRLAGRRAPIPDAAFEPTVTIILPVHNEAGRVLAKVANLLQLDYPPAKLQLVVVGDGCTDDSLVVAERAGQGRVHVEALPERAGKAAALNAGLARATGEIVVFTDAGILLEPASLRALVGHFADPSVGCVSGEDYIEGGGSEGLYGRLELLLRREEALLHSIAGASGCFYGKRRSLCTGFTPGMAPDFLSVLQTVRAGYRAISEPAARGSMAATTSMGSEFTRKSRTFLRGMTALMGNAGLLNPFQYGAFSYILWSHKLLRWMAPLALVGFLVMSFLLRDQGVYAAALYSQILLYGLAGAGMLLPELVARSSVIRLCSFFLMVNLAAARALLLWLLGVRQELWAPTRRPS